MGRAVQTPENMSETGSKASRIDQQSAEKLMRT